MTGVNGVKITGSTFTNEMAIDGDEIVDWGYGIFANDAGFDVQASPDGNIYPPTSYTHSEFNGLGYGIYTAFVLNNRPFRVKQSDFNNCFVGLRNKGVTGGTILFNNFNLGALPSIEPTNEQSGICYELGIEGYTCQENTFENAVGDMGIITIGIFSDDTGAFNKTIRRNIFDGLTVGNLAKGYNGENPDVSSLIRGMSYLCNQNYNVANDGADIDVVSGWIRREQGLVDQSQTTGYRATGNRLSHTGIDFINSGATEIEYFYDMTTPEQELLETLGPVIATPVNENVCPVEYCDPPCLEEHDADHFKSKYYIHRDDFHSALTNYIATSSSEALREMTFHQAIMDEAAYMVVVHQMYDTIGYDPDSLRGWINNMNSVSAELRLSNNHIASGEIETAIQLLDGMTEKYSLSVEEQADIQNYRGLVNLLGGETIYKLDSEVISLANNYDQIDGHTEGWARNLLTLYGAHYPPAYEYSTVIEERSSEMDLNDEKTESKAVDEYLVIQPNPASNFVYFRLEKPVQEGTRLIIRDINGKMIKKLNLQKGKEDYLWESKDIPSGVYIYHLIKEGFILQSGKIVLSK